MPSTFEGSIDKPVHSYQEVAITIISFDVESNGLHGKAFAIGAVVVDDAGRAVEQLTLRCLIEGSVDSFVAEHVLPVMTDVPETHDSYEAMIEAFDAFLTKHRTVEKGKVVKVLTFVPWPVEANVLSAIYSQPRRKMSGPFPVIDLATALDTTGHHPTSDEAYLRHYNLSVPFEGSGHHPLYDAWAAVVIYRHLMKMA